MKIREGKGIFFQCWIILAAFDSLMEVLAVSGMWYFISTKALSFTAKKKVSRRYICSTSSRHNSCGVPSSFNSGWVLGRPWWSPANSKEPCAWVRVGLLAYVVLKDRSLLVEAVGGWKVTDAGTLRACWGQVWWTLSRLCEFYPIGTSKWQVKILHLGRGKERRLLLPEIAETVGCKPAAGAVFHFYVA